MQNNIIEIRDNNLVISHRIIAEKTGNQEKTVSRLIRNHISSLELFGQVGFEIHTVRNSAGAVNDEKTYFLNESQATLLLTFMRNNEIVIDFKVRLVQEFYEMKKILKNEIQPAEKSLKQKVEDLELAVKHYENIEKIFKKFGNFSKRELAGKTSNYVFLETGIDFLKMFGGFPKDEKHSFQNSFSLTSLLEKHNIQIQTYKFNLKLEKLGIIEKRGKSWFILNFDFGRNEDYQNENNPRYFEETFEKLLNLVYPSKEICEMPTI